MNEEQIVRYAVAGISRTIQNRMERQLRRAGYKTRKCKHCGHREYRIANKWHCTNKCREKKST